MRAILIVCALLFASVASAGPIVSSASGCVSSLPTGASWVGEDFLFMAFHAPEKGCAPTIENPTRGLFIESTTLEGFRVDVPAFLLAGGCGRYQFDAHVRVPGGLSTAPGGLQTLVFDTGKDCELTVKSSEFTVQGITRNGGPVDNWPPIITDNPPMFPPEMPPTQPPVTVPENSSTWLLGGLSVFFMALRSRWS